MATRDRQVPQKKNMCDMYAELRASDSQIKHDERAHEEQERRKKEKRKEKKKKHQ